MTAKRRYANLPHDLRDSLPAVYADPALMGTYLQLYLVADSVWPNAPEAPRIVREEHADRLAELSAIVLDTEDRYRYRIPFLDDWREAEVERGRMNVMRRQDRPVKDKPPEPEHRADVRAFYERNLERGHRRGIEPPQSTNGRTNGRTLPARAPAPERGAARSEDDGRTFAEKMGGSLEEVIAAPSTRTVSQRMTADISEGDA